MSTPIKNIFVLFVAALFLIHTAPSEAHADFCAPAGPSESAESIKAKGMTPVTSNGKLMACNFQNPPTSACPPGQEYGDISTALKNRGLDVPSGITGCKKDAELLGLTCSIGDPVPYLMQRRGPNSAGQIIPDYEIQRMGSAFACNLAKFIDAGEKAGVVMRIYSGARIFRQPGASADCQRVPCVPSTHEFGCAADLTFNGARQVEINQCSGNAACAWAHANIANTGLQFRLMPQNGFPRPEPWHIELAGARGPANLNSQGYCPGSAGIPTLGGGLPAGTLGAQSPMSNLGNTLRNMFTPPQPVQCSIGYSLLNGQCVPQQFTTTQSPFEYMPPTPVSTTSPSASKTSSANDTTGTPNSPSAIDLINTIANPTSTVATSTIIGGSVALSDSLRNTVSLAGTAQSTSSATSSFAMVPVASQTFISDDLRLHTGAQTPISSTFTLLENMRQVLLSILSLMRPFGGVTPTGTIHSGQNTATAILR